MTAAKAFLDRRPVSRETLQRLCDYEALLARWNPAINLVSPSTLGDVWSRHFLDSAQVFDLAGAGAHWADLGSGGGFPGMVAAIIAADERPGLRFTLVESDRRKAAFLDRVAQATGVSVTVLDQRIEALPPLEADILTARAVAPLAVLLGHAARHLAPEGRALFPKGARSQAEIDEALESWRFSYEKVASWTAREAAIVIVGGIARV